MNNLIYPFLCLLFFLFMLPNNHAQEVKNVEFKTIKEQPIIQVQKKSPVVTKNVVPAERQSQTFTPISASPDPRVIQAKERVSPNQTIEYWDDYIEKAEKRIEELDPSSTNYPILKAKFENALENAKIRKALISQ